LSLICVDYPVYTLDKKLLLPGNTRIDRKTLDSILSSNKKKPYKTYSLFKYGSVKNDLLDSLSTPHYKVIFADRQKKKTVLTALEKVRLIPPVLESFDYFKKHDVYTYRHILNVFALSTLLAMDLLAQRKDLLKGCLAGPTHDFGKICVPLGILKKTTPLTQKEKKILEYHTVAGYILLSYYYRDKQNYYAKVARDHHERKNSSGYPRGIQLKDRMTEIVAVSDVYDALISKRPYRPTPFDNRSALEEIIKMAEQKQFIWKVVKALIALNRISKPHYADCVISREKRGEAPPDNLYGTTAREEKRTHTKKQSLSALKRIMRKTVCVKDYRCYTSGFKNLCRAEHIGMDSYLLCVDNIQTCNFSVFFIDEYLCKCPVRIYIAKELQK